MGRAAAAPELAATRRPLREAKRQPLIEDSDVRPRDCVAVQRRIRACSDRRLSKRLRPPSGLSWAATTASTGRLVSTATNRAQPVTGAIVLTSRGRAARAIAMPRRQSSAWGRPGRLQRRQRHRANPGRRRLSARSPSQRFRRFLSRSRLWVPDRFDPGGVARLRCTRKRVVRNRGGRQAADRPLVV